MKSNCGNFEKLLWDYPDGNLSASEITSLEKHLAGCNGCREALNTIQILKESSRENLNEISNSIDAAQFDREVLHKIAGAREQKYIIRRSTYIYRLGLSFAAAAVIVFFLIMATSEIKLFMPGKENLDTVKKDEFIIFQMQTQSDSSFRFSGSAEAPSERKLLTPPAPAASPETLTLADEALRVEKDQSENQPSGADIDKFETRPVVGSIAKSDLVKLEVESRTDTMPALSDNDSARVYAELPPQQFHARAAREGIIPMLPQSPDAKSIDKKIGMESAIALTQTTSQSLLITPLSNPAPESLKIEGIYIVDRTNVSQIKPIIAASLKEFSTAYDILDSVIVNDTLHIPNYYPRPADFLMPTYPVWALKQRQSGLVWILAQVGSDGKLSNINILGSNNSGFDFEESVIDAAMKSTYLPARCDASLCPAWIAYSVRFIYSK